MVAFFFVWVWAERGWAKRIFFYKFGMFCERKRGEETSRDAVLDLKKTRFRQKSNRVDIAQIFFSKI